MNYQMHFDPYLSEHLNHRHHELLQEMEVLRLEKRLRQNRKGQASQFTALVWRARCFIGRSLQTSPSPYGCR
jgi:hypothetical protein